MKAYKDNNNNIYFGDKANYNDIELTKQELYVYNFNRAKEQKYSEIKSSYESYLSDNDGLASVTLNGEIVDCREKDIKNLDVLISVLESENITESFYKLKNDEKIPVTTAQIKQVQMEIKKNLLGAWTKQDYLCGQIDLASTLEELEIISW